MNERTPWAAWTNLMIIKRPAKEEVIREEGSIPGSGRSPGEGNGNSLRYSCLENPTDRGAWRAMVHSVAKSWTRLNDYTQREKEGVSPFAVPPPSLSTTVCKWAVLWSFSSWYIRKTPKPHSDNKFSSWFLCQVWSGFRHSYSASLEQAATDQPQLLEPLPWTLFIPSSLSTSFIFHVYWSFSVS